MQRIDTPSFLKMLQNPAPPRISFLIPAFGVAEFLGETLGSVQAQTIKEWEAVVIDDGSTDDLAGALAPFALDRRIQLIRTKNQGVAAARNRAARAATSGVLALLDGDDMIEPDYAASLLAELCASPEASFVTCDATYIGLPDRAGLRFSAYCSQEGEPTLANVLSREFNVYTGSAVRRSAFERVGGYDASLRSAEDLDLWIRLLVLGEARYVDRPLARYRRRTDSLSSNTEAMAEHERVVYEKAKRALQRRPEGMIAAEML